MSLHCTLGNTVKKKKKPHKASNYFVTQEKFHLCYYLLLEFFERHHTYPFTQLTIAGTYFTIGSALSQIKEQCTKPEELLTHCNGN